MLLAISRRCSIQLPRTRIHHSVSLRHTTSCHNVVNNIRARATSEQEMTDSEYEADKAKAEQETLNAPEGQLEGRAGRRCVLEDGERRLTRCLEVRPLDLAVRLLLLRNLMLQNLGREREVPLLAMDTIRVAGAGDIWGQVDQVEKQNAVLAACFMLGLKALVKMGRADNIRNFMEDAVDAAPHMKDIFTEICVMWIAFMQKVTEDEMAMLMGNRVWTARVDLEHLMIPRDA